MQRKVTVITLVTVGFAVIACYTLDLVFVEKAEPSYVLATLFLMSLMALPVVVLALWFSIRKAIRRRRARNDEDIEDQGSGMNK